MHPHTLRHSFAASSRSGRRSTNDQILLSHRDLEETTIVHLSTPSERNRGSAGFAEAKKTGHCRENRCAGHLSGGRSNPALPRDSFIERSRKWILQAHQSARPFARCPAALGGISMNAAAVDIRAISYNSSEIGTARSVRQVLANVGWKKRRRELPPFRSHVVFLLPRHFGSFSLAEQEVHLRSLFLQCRNASWKLRMIPSISVQSAWRAFAVC